MPLWFSLQHDEDVALIPDTPSRLAAMMSRGEIDVGLLPVVEVLRDDRLSFLSDLGVSADGPVDSVGLFTRAELSEVRHVVLSAASRTSNALARVILNAEGAMPEFMEAGVRPEELADREEDAVLMIGDACLRARVEKHDRVFVDLSAEWKLLTGLPFVFAVWAGQRQVLTQELHAKLRAALRDGRELAFDMVRYAAIETGWSEAALSRYLNEVIIHELTQESLKGLLEFARRAAALELAPSGAVDKVLSVVRGDQ